MRTLVRIVVRRSVMKPNEFRTCDTNPTPYVAWDFQLTFISFLYRPKKVKPETSPEVLRSIEEKLAAMALGHTPDSVEAAA